MQIYNTGDLGLHNWFVERALEFGSSLIINGEIFSYDFLISYGKFLGSQFWCCVG